MGKETRHESEKDHGVEKKDDHEALQQSVEHKTKDLDPQARDAVKKAVTGEKHGEHGGEHGEAKHGDAAAEHGEHGGEHGIQQQLEHWAHTYAHAMHSPHLAMEGLEKFAHLVGELGAGPIHHFLEGVGGKLVKGTLSVLCVPMAIAHSKDYAEKAAEAYKSGNSSAGTYYAMQAILQAGSAIPEIGLAFTFVSEMLQVSEGKGLVYEYLVKNIEKWDGNKLRDQADVVFANHTATSDLIHKMGGEGTHGGASAKLNVVSHGHKSREAAFAAVKRLREENMLQEDYAVTQDGDGTFAVHTLESNQPLAFDMDDKRELESAVLKHENQFNIVALVAEDGTWGKVQKVQMDGWARWDVIASGKI